MKTAAVILIAWYFLTRARTVAQQAAPKLVDAAVSENPEPIPGLREALTARAKLLCFASGVCRPVGASFCELQVEHFGGDVGSCNELTGEFNLRPGSSIQAPVLVG